MIGRLRNGEKLASVGVLLTFIATFKPWFELPGAVDLENLAPDAVYLGGAPAERGLNIWDLSVGRWFIYLAILFTAWMIIAAIANDTPRWALTLNTPSLFFSTLAALNAIVHLIWPPENASLASFFWLAVAGILLMLAGTAWSFRDETVPDAYRQAPPPEHIKLEST